MVLCSHRRDCVHSQRTTEMQARREEVDARGRTFAGLLQALLLEASDGLLLLSQLVVILCSQAMVKATAGQHAGTENLAQQNGGARRQCAMRSL